MNFLSCKSCGHHLGLDARFCENCGAVHENSASTTSIPATSVKVAVASPVPFTQHNVVKFGRAAVSTWVIPFNATLVFGGTLVGVFDFLSPRVSLLPIAATVAVIGLLAAIALRRFVAPSLPADSTFRRALAPEARLYKSPVLIATGLLSALMVTGAAWSGAASAGGGVLASNFDAARAAQTQIGILKAVQKEQRQQTAVLEDIRDGRSNNPRRVLSSQGTAWTENAFNDALRNRDLPVIALFLEGGMRWRLDKVQLYLNSGDNEAAKLFLSYPALGDGAKSCERFMNSLSLRTADDKLSPPDVEPKLKPISSMERSYLKTFCSQPESKVAAFAMLKKAQEKRDQELARYKAVKDAVIPQQQCVQQASTRDGEALFTEASKFNILGSTTYSSRQELLAGFNVQLMAGNASLTPALIAAIKKYCLGQATPSIPSNYAGMRDFGVAGVQQVIDALQ